MNERLESNSLPAIADRIHDLVAESDSAALTSIEKAMDAGRLLVEAKSACRHGEWLPFVERSGMKERRARQYMQLAQSGLESATVADLGGIRGALEFLAKRKNGDDALARALDSFASGGFGIAAIEDALVIMDEAILMFPEEMREGLERFEPEHDAELIALRLAGTWRPEAAAQAA